MDLRTVSAILESGNKVVGMLAADHLAQKLETIAKDPNALLTLRLAVDRLEMHLRVLGATPVNIGTSQE